MVDLFEETKAHLEGGDFAAAGRTLQDLDDLMGRLSGRTGAAGRDEEKAPRRERPAPKPSE